MLCFVRPVSDDAAGQTHGWLMEISRYPILGPRTKIQCPPSTPNEPKRWRHERHRVSVLPAACWLAGHRAEYTSQCLHLGLCTRRSLCLDIMFQLSTCHVVTRKSSLN
ncbi:hypothetical protein DPMN_178094 [Dreissena polymorpha]|uniref:Uncharacterized protein n=1 Tax=Dreissena polymorpha TaxID=45954 RepID=A0A9D4EBI1_DREPO|nr:hypothetical protein DPMN_178094 [Dreissena polymorpha]